MAIHRAKYRSKYLRYHDRYEKAAYKELQKVFRKWGRSMSWDLMTESNYTNLMNESINQQDMMEAYIEIYSKIGVVHGNRVGRSINAQIKAEQKEFVPNQFETTYLHDLMIYLQQFGMARVVSVTRTYFDEMVKLMSTRIDKGMSVSQAAREIEKLVNKRDFYRWQALRIARTEATAAANYAAQEAGKVAGYAMDKIWISGIDDRTREDHNEVNGVRIPSWQKFNVGGEQLNYPGDNGGSAWNVINCRCSAAYTPAKDRNGNLIELNGGAQIQNRVNTMQSFEDSIRHQNFESAAYYNSRGVEIFRKDGGKKSVSFNLEDRKKIQENKGGTLTHNHPKPWSFSEADINFTIVHDLKAIRAVNTLNEDYIMEFNSVKAREMFSSKQKLKASVKNAQKKAKKIADKKTSESYRYMKEAGLEGDELRTEYTKQYYDNMWKAFTQNTNVGKKLFKYTGL